MEGKSSEGCRLDFWPSRILELPSDRSKAAVFVLAIAFGRVVFAAAFSASIIMSPSVVYPKENVSLFCITYGNPQPSVLYWVKDGNPLRVDSHVQLLLGGVQVRVLNLQQDDAGRYDCITSAQINGSYLKASAVLEIGSFGSSLNATYATEESNTTLSCIGTNMTLVRWYRGGKRLEGISRFQEGGDGETLTILNVQLSDQGIYTCEGFHSLGKLYSEVFLQVIPFSSHDNPEQNGNLTSCTASDLYVIVHCDANMTVYFKHNTNCTPSMYLFQVVSYDPATEEVELVHEGDLGALAAKEPSFVIPYPLDCTICKVYGIDILLSSAQGTVGQPVFVQSYNYLRDSSVGSRSCSKYNRHGALLFSRYPQLQFKLKDVNCTCLGNYSRLEARDSIEELLADIVGKLPVNLSVATIETNSARSQLLYRAQLRHLSLYETIEWIKFIWAGIRQLDSIAVGSQGCRMRFDLNCRTLLTEGFTDSCRTDTDDGCSRLFPKQAPDAESRSNTRTVTVTVTVLFVAAVLILATIGIVVIKWRRLRRTHNVLE